MNNDTTNSPDGGEVKLTTQYLEFDTGVSLYRGNPCIGALGKIRDEDESFELLKLPKPPTDDLATQAMIYNPKDMHQPAHLRVHCVQTIKFLFLPTDAHIAFDREVGMLIRLGYVRRNPFSAEFRDMVRGDRDYLRNGMMPPERFGGGIQPILGGCVVGPPGNGKTVSARSVMASYRRAIHHVYEFHGVRYAFIQVPVLMLEVSPNCSLKELALEFFRKLGEAVEKNLVHEWRVEAGSANSLQPLIYAACREYHVGLLIIDEAQNVTARGHTKTYAMEYLSKLMNCIGIPIVLIGTDSIGGLIEGWLTLGRRFTSGMPRFEPFTKCEAWEAFVEQVLKYRYVRKESRAADLSDTLLDLSGGIPDLVIKLYMFTQIRLFGREDEQVTKEALNETAAALFHLVSNQVTSLKVKGGKLGKSEFAAALAEVSKNNPALIDEFIRRLRESQKPVEVTPKTDESHPPTAVAPAVSKNPPEKPRTNADKAAAAKDIRAQFEAEGVIEPAA